MAIRYALLVDDDWDATVYEVMFNGQYINPKPLGHVHYLGYGDVPPDCYEELDEWQERYRDDCRIRSENDAEVGHAYDSTRF